MKDETEKRLLKEIENELINYNPPYNCLTKTSMFNLFKSMIEKAIRETKKEILEKGDKIFYSEDYGDDKISNECFDYASKKWDKLKKEIKK